MQEMAEAWDQIDFEAIKSEFIFRSPLQIKS